MTMIHLANIPPVEIHSQIQSAESAIISTRAALAAFAGDNEAVLQEYDNYIGALLIERDEKHSLTQADLLRILDAVHYAAQQHVGQVRKSAEKLPYIIHPIGVSRQILEIGQISDPDTLIAALLHDVVEDTFPASDAERGFSEIRARFGEAVEGYVREVSDDKNLPKAERKQKQIDNAPHKSPGAAAIKFSDKFYNLSDMLLSPPEGWPQERVDAYFAWAQKVIEALPASSDNLAVMKKTVLDLIEEATKN